MLNQRNVNICVRDNRFSICKCKSQWPCVNRGNETIWNHLLIQISIWVFVIMASPPLLCNYRLLSSAARFTLQVWLSTCVWEWVRMCESECTWQAYRNIVQPERACGWPVTLNVHWGGLIITNNACGETYYILCDMWVMTGVFFSVGKVTHLLRLY